MKQDMSSFLERNCDIFAVWGAGYLILSEGEVDLIVNIVLTGVI